MQVPGFAVVAVQVRSGAGLGQQVVDLAGGPVESAGRDVGEDEAHGPGKVAQLSGLCGGDVACVGAASPQRASYALSS